MDSTYEILFMRSTICKNEYTTLRLLNNDLKIKNHCYKIY